MITGDPILPPELERDIFELVVSIDTDLTTDYRSHQHVGDTVLVLPRVCRRVQSWIEPLIYERVALLQNSRGRDPFTALLSTVDARPATFFRRPRQASLPRPDGATFYRDAHPQCLHRRRELWMPSSIIRRHSLLSSLPCDASSSPSYLSPIL
ncbi:hypothetical protein FB45DRAFT_161916 [Roridomyces roridus]|uniref:Uncharacterized protein n=1 Tax=Roridomyces roridus TaxID=1738132 RepID=A0AAD7BFP1_9AGAR|nr:hypothetical protein FB45DRAFT_161916 [Roridomyces roridus]